MSVLLTYRDLSVALGVKVGTLKRWKHEGMPSHELPGHRIRLDPEEVQGWIEMRRADTTKLRRLRDVSFHRHPVIYFARSAAGLIKIGFTSDPSRRADELEAEIEATVAGDKRIEALFHRAFAEDRIGGEWFRPSDRLTAFVRALMEMQTEVAA